MNNKEISNSRKVLLNFFTINFDFIDKDTMISKMINFYLYPKINSLSKEKNIHIDYSGNEIQIEHNDILTTINLINHYADSETKINTINAITNIFKLYPFNTIDTLCSILKYIIVNEAGASVYSASKLATEEFPNFDVGQRSATSMARRLQDPLAELVKIPPEAIGVGQYQHDMNQKKLNTVLGGVVEDCVNMVGVDVNSASPSLLEYVSGISSTIAENIVKYREDKGPFKTRSDLLNVNKLGPKAYDQCAAFLRITNGDALENTGVHPESYDATIKLLKELGLTTKDLNTEKCVSLLNGIENTSELAKKLGIGEPTLVDIIEELKKPGRDPRDEAQSASLRQDVLEIKDLKEGMILEGTVRNIMDFGVFVDIGVHHDGFIHISKLSNKFVKHPLDIVKLNDIVKVKVIGVDVEKERISLSLKDVE